MISIAISYRSEDIQIAKDLHLRLAGRFGESSVFLADRSLKGGQRWEPPLLKAFKRADFVVVIVGRFWAAKADGSHRLGEEDYVRKELEAACSGDRCKGFFPIFIDDASFPPLGALLNGGEAIKSVFQYQAFRLDSREDTAFQLVCDLVTAAITQDETGVLSTFVEFPIDRVKAELSRAEQRFLVWHTWTEYFKLYLRWALNRFLKYRWEHREPICHFLLAHPDCHYADLRARLIRKSTLQRLLEETLRDLKSVAESVADTSVDQIIQVRLYTSYPAKPLYIVDQRAFVGWYPSNTSSHHSPYVEVHGQSRFLASLEAAFVATWDRTEWEWNFSEERIQKVGLSDESAGWPAL